MGKSEAELLEKAVHKIELVVKTQLASLLAQAGLLRDRKRLDQIRLVWEMWSGEKAEAAPQLGQPVKTTIDSEGQTRPIRVDLPSELGSKDSCS